MQAVTTESPLFGRASQRYDGYNFCTCPALIEKPLPFLSKQE